jgi:uncharacterized repeat protein (TIGR03803 family)
VRTQLTKLATVLIAGFLLSVSGQSQGNVQKIPCQRPPSAGYSKPVARCASSNQLNLIIGLPLRNSAALTNLLHDLYDPASPAYHKYLTASQFTERFGPAEQDYEAVAQFAASHGLKISGVHANRTMLDVSGSVADVEKTFHVQMWEYQHPTEARTFFAANADPSVDLTVPLLGIVGLDNLNLPHPVNPDTAFDSTNAPMSASGSGPVGSFLGSDFRSAYMPGVGLNGKGQSVGLFELDGYYASDIAEYESLAKLPGVTLSNILLNGFSGTPGANEIEVTLDIDMAISMAPGLSSVLVYEGTSPDDILNRMATDNLARQLSCSWSFPPAMDPMREQAYEQFAAQGQTMFQASGNSGAYSGEPAPPTDDPNVTVVGGTLLATSGAEGPWSAETAWSGSSGGSSTIFPIPTWQQGLSNPANQGSPAFRNIPDVAGVAGVSIWLIADDGQQGVVGGTSAASPLWAGIAAMANQRAAAQGLPPIGFINPKLYDIGRSADYAAAFHDITSGNNTNSASPANFFAVPGYDLCTGWGTPAGNELIKALLRPPDALQVFPATNLTAGGPTGGPFSPAAQNIDLTNIGAASVSWAAAGGTPWLNIAPASGTISPGGPASPVTLTLNSAATNLPPGTYAATIWFTNQSNGFTQSRQLLLNVAVTSAAPLIVTEPLSQAALPGATAVFAVTAAGGAPLSYQWRENSSNLSDGGNVSGSTTATLIISNISSAAAGTYSVVVSNALNSVASSGAVLTVASVTSPGVDVATVYSFTGTADGANPNGLMQETNGNFYGTTQDSGDNAAGTVFQLTPGGVLTTLHSFSDSDGGGASPEAGLVQGPDGNLYGTTELGGAKGWGIIFKINTNGGLTTAYTFDGGDGAFPSEPMIVGADGNLYGTTSSGGPGGFGEAFQLKPDGALTQIASFDYAGGSNPNKLIQAADGAFYGTTFEGGTNGDGVIFTATTNGPPNIEFFFSYLDTGYLPLSGLAQTPGGDFFGTTSEGGEFGYGTVFSLVPSVAFETLYSFTGGNDGGHPSADLIRASDGNFYGTTVDGGVYGNGTLFRWTPDGALKTLVSFDGYDGANPEAPLVQGADGNIYGTTQNGGATGNGVIFCVNMNYASLQITGQPVGQSVFSGGVAIFSVAVTGNPPLAFQWRKNGANLTDAGNISGSLTPVLTISNVGPSDTAVYSVTVSNAAGFAASQGAFLAVLLSPPQFTTPLANQTASVGGSALFNAEAVGNLPLSFQWQSNQINLTDGANVAGATTDSLLLSGLTQSSDATYSVIVSNADGVAGESATLTVFPVSVPGTQMESLYWFTGGDDGAVPNGLAIGADGILYGTTQTNGAYDAGTIFSITTNGLFQTLVSFNGANGSNSQAALTQGADGNFYGTTEDGGSNSQGTVFQITTNGVLTTLAAFDAGYGANPDVALTQGTNGYFYGAAQNLSKPGDGDIFEITPTGPDLVYSFSGGPDGNEAVGALTQGRDGNFYGMTTAGGAYNFGGIFKMTPAGALTNLYSFTGGTDGYNPYGALVQGTDGDFYGVTRRNHIDGTNFDGTIFKCSTNGSLTTLYALNPAINGDGEYPFAGLIEGADGNFYGATLLSDIAYTGTIFRVTPAGGYTTLTTFTGADDGAEPKAAMVQDSAGNLYGTTTSGGPYEKGTIFRLRFTSAPQITLQPSNLAASVGSAAQFAVCVFGASPLSYQWQKNGAALFESGRVSGSAARVLSVSTINGTDAGTYSVIVSNALGTVTSSTAVLTVLVPPPAFESLSLAGGMLTFTWNASPGQMYQVQSATNLASGDWTDVAGVITATNVSSSATYPIGAATQQFYRVLLLQ